MSNEIRIPLMRPLLPRLKDLEKYIERIDRNRIYSNFGELTRELESELAAWVFRRTGNRVDAVTFCSATLGLEVMLELFGLPEQSKVLIPDLTFPATCTAVQRARLVPVACDVDNDSLLMSVDSIAEVDLSNVSAVIPVSTFGAPQDVDLWRNWSERTGIKVLIDAAAAFGGQQVCTGVPAVFSLHATKALGSAEGGFVLVADDLDSAEIRSLTNFGLTKRVTGFGTNAKMSEYHAAIALAALEGWDSSVAQRREIFKTYTRMISSRISDTLLIKSLEAAYVPSVFLIRLPNAASRERCEVALAKRGIQYRRWYTPLISKHPNLVSVPVAGPRNSAVDIENTLLGLPFFIGLTVEEIEEVVATIACAI